METRPPLVIALHLCLFMLTVIGAVTASAIPTVVYMLTSGEILIEEASDLPGLVVGIGSLIQNALFMGGAVGFALLYPLSGGRLLSLPFGEVSARLAHGIALRRSSLWWWGASFIGGLTIGLLSSRVAHWLQVFNFPSFGGLEFISELLTDGDPVARAVFLFCVVIGAPIAEELLFRGYLWRILEGLAPPPAILAITTLAFAAVHMDPTHVVGLLPTALLLGLLRWHSGSILPCILAHLINNFLASYMVNAEWATSLDSGLGFPDLVAVVAALTSFGAIFMAWRATRSHP